MHNKSFVVDNQVAVVGGRNIGDEYFAAGEGVAFVDLDALLTGAVVPTVSSQFDRYWNSASAYPARQFLQEGQAEPPLPAQLENSRAGPGAARYLEAVRTTAVVQQLLNRALPFEWTRVALVADDPAKTLDTTGKHELLMFPQLIHAFGRPAREFDLITPYFVPGDAGTEALAAMARGGVRVRILTNSLAASDVSAVHAGYAKRRVELLRAGVQLFELKPSVGVRPADRSRVGSSSSAGLHAKTFAVDRSKIFIGSFNFDPRSARLNTELGLVIDSAALAQQLAAVFDRDVPQLAYEVRLMDDGVTLQWIERTSAGERRFASEPGSGWWKRLTVDVLSVLPIEWML
jgi:putative cardiolipin synthase